MQSFSYFTLPLLCLLSLLSSVLSKKCTDQEYPWPLENPHLCCPKCPPGQLMRERSASTCEIKCDSCKDDRYMETYNVKNDCKVCDACSNPHMEPKSKCSPTRNTVCGCKAGYRCKDNSCTICVPIPTTKPTLPTPTTALRSPSKPIIKDTVWFLVITALLVAGIALVVVTKLKPFLRWIRFNKCHFPTENVSPTYMDEVEDVSEPIQEVCGKCDQPIDLFLKV